MHPVATSDSPALRVEINSHTPVGEGRTVLANCRFSCASGRIRCVVGRSGAGKTTLVRVIAGLADGVTRGDVRFELGGGVRDRGELRRDGRVGLLGDSDSLVPWLSVRKNLELPALLNPNLGASLLGHIEECLAGLGLDGDAINRLPHELSFGMRRRVALARVLVANPAFVLLDEAFTGLDPRTRSDVAGFLRAYVSRTNAVCLVVTHEMDTASSVGDDFTVISANGSVADVTTPLSALELQRMLDSGQQGHPAHATSTSSPEFAS